MKRILFCTPFSLTKSQGAAKVVVELAEEMRLLGWRCDLLSLRDLTAGSTLIAEECLRRYLHQHAGQYDVVDYDHEFLPYPRSEFSAQTLFVARSVLLVHHLETIPIPSGRSLKAKAGAITKGYQRQQERRDRICRAQTTVEAADLINVSNNDDFRELVRRGLSPDKIIVLPYGLSHDRQHLFNQVCSKPPDAPCVAFVGTFDYRKGAREFPDIVQAVAQTLPNVRFNLLGVQGLYQTSAGILGCFPRRLHKHLDVTLTYDPNDLPSLLASCSVGVFPSYMEGFAFGVLEMQAASLPVLAYDAPGAPMMLPPEQLAPRGNWQTLSAKVVQLLQNQEHLAIKRQQAKLCSQQFDWQTIAERTQDNYIR